VIQKKVLLTGSSGFLGKKILDKLLSLNHIVIVLKSINSYNSRVNDDLLKIIEYDFNEAGIDNLFANYKIDIIIHTATCYGRNNEEDSFVLKSNLNLPQYLIQKAIKYNVDSFFYTSTLQNELLNPYTISKNQLKQWGQYYSTNNKINFINIKIEHLYGPGDDKNKFVYWLLHGLISNTPSMNFTKGIQKRDFIYITDAVDAIELIIKKKNIGYCEFEIGTGKAITLKNFIKLSKKLVSRKMNTKIETALNFGAVPERIGEPSKIQANVKNLINLNWKINYSIEAGLEKTIIDILKIVEKDPNNVD
jgi:nucleoside-diphosphate-sugar epimerase